MRLQASEAFVRAQKIRSDWDKKKFKTKTELAKHYEISVQYVTKILNGLKCKDIAPPKGNYKDVELFGVRYAIYSDGRVWSYTKNFLLTFTRRADDYARFFVERGDGTRQKIKVHQIVMQCFGKPRPKGATLIRHLDDDPYNNDISNLAWGNDKSNMQDKIRNENGMYGESLSTAKLNRRQVREFMLSYDGSCKLRTHIDSFIEKHALNISVRVMQGIARGQGWKFLNLPAITCGENNTGFESFMIKSVREKFKSHGKEYESKNAFAKAVAKSIAKKIGRPVYWKSVLACL